MHTGNKGEWSELYVFLKLLGDGKLYAADSDLNKVEDLYYPLVEIPRKENNSINHYVKNEKNINITDNDGNLILKLPASEFEDKAKVLLKTIKESNATFPVPKIEEFMSIIKCTKIKADSLDKSDITIILHDCKTLRNEKFGFSIKSNLGKTPTLFNSGKSTNFTYEIKGKLTEKQIDEINSINSNSKIRDRINSIISQGCNIQFVDIEHEICKSNFQMIDTKFPMVMAEYMLLYYSGKGKFISELTENIKQINPCNYNLTTGQNFYEHKIKDFLVSSALGMTSAKVWSGNYDATGGYIIVKEDGEILCFHVYNHNEFREYLFKNTKFDTPSTTKFDFGNVYSVNNKNYIKLNLQIKIL